MRFLRRWMARRREAVEKARIEAERAEFYEVCDVADYYIDQVDRLNIEIDIRHTELTGLVMVRNTLALKRDGYIATQAQLEAAYRSG